MNRYQQLKPYLLKLVGGFTHVTVIPSGAPHHAGIEPLTPAALGCSPDEYRILGPHAVDDGSRFCAFRDFETARRIARAVGDSVTSYPSGYPEMLVHTIALAAAYWYVETEYPGTPFQQIESGPPLLESLAHATFHERAVAVLASSIHNSDALSAVLHAVAVTDGSVFRSEHDDGWVLVTKADPFTDRRHRGRDIALIQKLASAHAQARTQYPDTPVSALLGRHARWDVLRTTCPRTHAIALAAVALGQTRGAWNVERAVMLIDGCDMTGLAAIPRRDRIA